MNDEEYYELSKIRLERAEELLSEAKLLLDKESYKSANNRAYYSIEKSLSALLAISHVQTKTHKGCLLQFRNLYITDENDYFTINDYVIAADAERIRNASDYNDFYIVTKNEVIEQIEHANYIFNKVKDYIEQMN